MKNPTKLQLLQNVIDAQEDIISFYAIENDRYNREDEEIPDDLLEYEKVLEKAEEELRKSK